MLRGRLIETKWPAAVYAIGDVHGCLDQLLALEALIVEDAATVAGEKWLVTLGDYVDRGPDSAGVVQHLLGGPPPGFGRRIALRGNHEQAMLDFIADPIKHEYWLFEGGLETLRSYGIEFDSLSSGLIGADVQSQVRDAVPAAHLRFIDGLPLMLMLPRFVFVHAGMRPGVSFDRQTDEDLIWIREPFLSAPPTPGFRVVHGHTPVREPVVTAARIGIDTRCFATGRLTAVRITPDGATKLLAVG